MESPGIREEAHLLSQGWNNARIVANGSLSPGVFFPSNKRLRLQRLGGGLRKVRRRAVLKNGECNVQKYRMSRRGLRFLQDIFTTLVDTQWRWTLLVFTLSFILSWLAFAVIWWLIAFTHGDIEKYHLPDYQSDSGWKPCMTNINDFTSCFLFSIETQHTIGYGSRLTTEECPEAICVMCMQSIFGVMMQAFMVGIVFAKMTRPKHRSQTLLFSKYAAISQREGEMCLMLRVGDMRKSHIIGASIRAHLIKCKTTKEGECLTQYQTDLQVSADGCNSDFFFIWPLIITHKIDTSSPLYSFSAADMIQDRFEIVVILEGTIESTGQSTQARSSYLSTEILWGHRFDPLVSYNKDKQSYEVDYSKFNEMTQVDTPLCSAKELEEFYKGQADFNVENCLMTQPDMFRKESVHIEPEDGQSSSSTPGGKSEEENNKCFESEKNFEKPIQNLVIAVDSILQVKTDNTNSKCEEC